MLDFIDLGMLKLNLIDSAILDFCDSGGLYEDGGSSSG
jgi:hypothetical protein